MKIYILPILFIQILLCLSCGSGKNEMIFSESESLLETDPDSALSVLDSILYPEELNAEEYNRYILLKIQAGYKSYQDITSDSTILSVKEYYLKKEDIHNIALSAYYCGCFFKESGKQKEAMSNYLLASSYAENTNDWNLKGLIENAIGVLLSEQFDFKEALRRFKKSAFFYNRAGNLKNEVISYIQIGDSYQYLEKPDSTLYYYMNSLHLADANSLRVEQSCVRQNIGVYYLGIGKQSNAAQYLKEALIYEPNQIGRIRIYNILADLYSQSHQLDSAFMYINQSLQRKDSVKELYIDARLYEILSNIREQQGDYSGALESHKIYTDYLLSIFDTKTDKNLLELQKKYDYEKVQVQNIRLRLNRTYLLFSFITGIILISLVAYFFYRRVFLNKKKMSELEDKVIQLKNMANDFDTKEKLFRSYLSRHFDILKKAASLEIYANRDTSKKNDFWLKKFNEIVYGQDTFNWDILYNMMNELYEGFFIRLRNQYFQLDEVEFRIICLTYTKFTSDEIAIILKLSVNTIHTKRSAIRKKIGIKAFGNLNDFLDEKMSGR